jgi:hypothetical protein
MMCEHGRWAENCFTCAMSRWRLAQDASQGVHSGSQKSTSSAPESPGTSNTIFRHGRAGKSGRPQVDAVEQRRKARERSRAYRARQRTDSEDLCGRTNRSIAARVSDA